MASKQASRVLVNLFDPELTVPAQASCRWRFDASSSPTQQQRRAESLAHRKGVLPPMIETQVPSCFLAERQCRLWNFVYFHKSGAVKDIVEVHLRFDEQGHVTGRGIDQIGSFVLSGRSELDIVGWTYILHKTYQAMDDSSGAGEMTCKPKPVTI